MKFTLPLPPSINQTYGVSRSGSHTLYKRSTVKRWEVEAGYTILSQREGQRIPFSGAVKVGVAWFYKVDRDIDAGIKVLFDLLQLQRIVENDRQIREVMYITIAEDKEKPRVEVEILSL